MTESFEGYRLSPQQGRLWSLQQIGGDFGASAAISLQGELDRDALRRAVQRVVERHEALRTRFQVFPQMNVPLQVVGDGALDWKVVDGPAPEVVADRPAEGPPLRATLVVLAPREHLLRLELPALCADSATLLSLAREIFREYAGSGAPPEPPMQSIDASEWQNGLLESGEGAEHWRRRHLSGLADWRLPFQAPPSSAAEPLPYRPESVELTLPAAIVEDAERLTAACGVPLEVFFLAAWQALLGRLTGARRPVVAAAFDGRGYEELQEALGLFARYLPLAVEIDVRAPFRELLAQTAEAWREAATWQESFTWERVEAAAVADLPAGFSFDSLPPELPAPAGLQVTLAARRVCFERCSLELHAERREDGGLAVSFRFDPVLFPGPEIDRLGGEYRALVQGALATPGAALGELDLLGEGERRHLLADFNATAAPRQEACLHRAFAAQAARTPDAPAVAGGGRSLTFAELDAAANRVARALRRRGAGPDRRIAVAVGRSPELLVALLGVLKAGAAYLPLDGSQPRERLAWMLEDSGSSVLVTAPGFAGELPPAQGLVLDLEADREEIAAESGEEPTDDMGDELAGDHLAYVLYTSGSTGRPKGVMVTHRGLANYLSWALATYPVAAGRGAPVHSPIGFDLTVTSLFLPLLAGGTAVLLPDEQGLGALAAALEEGGLGLVKLTPAHLDALSELLSAEAAGRCARCLVLGGEALAGEKLEHWRRASPEIRLFNEYGPTETVVGCCVFEAPPGDVPPGPVPIGRPIANTRLFVLDSELRPVPVWVPGELWIGGDGLARGYLGRPGLTAERFAPDPFGGPGERLYRTGDLVRHLPDGNLEFLGRADQQVKVRGYRIEPGEVEAALLGHPEVRECAVIARDESAGKRLVAYVVPAEEGGAQSAKLRRFLEERLPAYMVPAIFVPLPSLPLTANGKVDRRALPTPSAVRRDLDEPYVPPQGPVEEMLAEVWGQVLGLDRVGVEESFFALGGDSIRSIQVRTESAKRGVHLSVQQMFQHPTIRSLARALRQELHHGEEAWERTAPFTLLREEDRRRLPAEVEDAYPVALLQAGMLFHSEIDPQSAVYHDIHTFHMRGPLDPAALRTALQRLAERHSVLRTSFDLSGFSEPLQLVHRTVEMPEVPVALEDLADLSADEQERAVLAWIEREKRQPFEWRRPPLLRIQVHRRSPQSFQLSLAFHHAILDGWSVATMMSELFRHYLFLVGAEAVPAGPPPELRYADFVAAERRTLASDEARRYWAGVVSDAPLTALPRWAPPQGARDMRLHFSPIPADLADGLRRLAQRAGVPVKSVLLAAHLRVLSLLSGDPDVMTGLVSNGRPEEEGGERVLGLFLNTLPMRVRLAGGTWIDLVREVFAAERDHLPHRRFPLAELQRMAGGRMLFETVFNFVHFHVYESVGGLRGLDVLAGGGFEEANYPFAANFSLSGAAGPIEMRFDYDATEFGGEAIQAVAGYYQRTLAALATEPEARYERSAPLGDEERLRLLTAGEGEETPDRAGLVHERLSALAALQPAALAVVGEEENLTFADLEARANRLSHRLVHLGAGPETRVGVCLRRTPELLVAFFGALKSGAAYVPFDPDYPRERLAALLADARPAVLVTEEAVAGRLPEVDLPTLLLDRDRDAIAAEPAEAPEGGVAPESAAYVVYTSGSTGAPKGVVVPHGALTNFSRGIAGALGLGPGHRVLQFASPAFDASALQIYPTLTSGAVVVIHPDPAGLTGQEILDLCMRQGITLLDLPGALWRQWVAEMAARGEALPPGITLYLTGGERLSAETLRQWAGVVPTDALFLSSYGPTEATVTTTVFMLRAGDVASWTPSPAPLGRALPNTRILLLDFHGEPAPVGVPGELYIGGAGLARGYLGRPDLTAERFVPAPGSRPGERLYRTGDLGRRAPGGGLEFLGRTDHQVKIRGYRVEPAEVEAALARHPAVREAVVLAREERPGDRRLVAWVTPQPDASLTVPDLRQHAAGALPDFMVPSAFILLAEMPLLPSGKVDRRALPAPDGTQVPRSAAYQVPRSPVEQVVAEIWSQVLGVEKIGVFDSFFELGGHSLMATQVITRVREAFEIDLQLRNVFESPTVAGLAEAVLADPERRQQVERTAALRVQLAALSDEEVEAMLAVEDAGELRG